MIFRDGRLVTCAQCDNPALYSFVWGGYPPTIMCEEHCQTLREALSTLKLDIMLDAIKELSREKAQAQAASSEEGSHDTEEA